jgi:hypothetical protein
MVASTNTSTSDLQVITPQFNGEIEAVAAVDPNITIEVLQYSLAGMATRFGAKARATASADPDNACFRLLVSKQFSSDLFIMGPTVAIDASLSWDTFFSGDIGMERYPYRLFLIDDPIYDSGEQCAVPPVAAAGQDITVASGQTVLLDGSASHDPAGGTITQYRWTQVDGPPVQLAGADTVTPSFPAPVAPATLTLRLTVTNTAAQRRWMTSSSPSSRHLVHHRRRPRRRRA